MADKSAELEKLLAQWREYAEIQAKALIVKKFKKRRVA